MGGQASGVGDGGNGLAAMTLWGRQHLV
jgi:hypothetical protein